eukprot:scaffold188533_cov32-Tisochrysis_lutea.AAC.2
MGDPIFVVTPDSAFAFDGAPRERELKISLSAPSVSLCCLLIASLRPAGRESWSSRAEAARLPSDTSEPSAPAAASAPSDRALSRLSTSESSAESIIRLSVIPSSPF